MKLKIEIDCDGDVFCNNGTLGEILEDLGDKIQNFLPDPGSLIGTVVNLDGNKIGSFDLNVEGEDETKSKFNHISSVSEYNNGLQDGNAKNSWVKKNRPL